MHMYRLVQNKLKWDRHYGNEQVGETERERIQMTQHNEGILKAGAGTETPQKPLNSDLSGCGTVFKLVQITVFNSVPLITGDGAG